MVSQTKSVLLKWCVVVLSLLLFFFAVPHTLEDFTLGEPARNGVPVPVLSVVIAGLFALQGLGLFELGRNRRWGYLIHTGLGIFWPLAAASAQLPVILTTHPYRAGISSLLYVFGMIACGLLLCIASLMSLSLAPAKEIA